MPSLCITRARVGRTRRWPRSWVATTRRFRTWVRDAGQGARPGAVEATAMEKENRQLRARVKELELEREILRRAAKYFAVETSW